MTNYTTQAARDAAPTVAPVDGCYALLRNGWLIDPDGFIEEIDLDDTPYYLPANSDEDYYWINGGVCQRDTYPNGVPTVLFEPSLDIIATFTPAQLLAPRPDHTCPVQIEKVAKAIMFQDCGSTEDWLENTDLAIAALKAMEDLT